MNLDKRDEGPGYALNAGWAALRDLVREGLESLVSDGRATGHTLSTALDVVLQEVKEGWARRSPEIVDGCANLVRHGWFPDPVWPWTIFLDFAGQDLASYEDEFVDHFHGRAPAIRESLGRSHPRRTAILEEAFDAHARKWFALSIPVFLAQAEGITVDVLGKRGYRACQAKGGVRSYELGKHLDDRSLGQVIMRPFLEAFIQPPPLLQAQTDQLAASTGLNRHSVLHGIDTDYPSKANSCRALSWLQWVDWALKST